MLFYYKEEHTVICMKKVTVALSVLFVLFAVIFAAGCITEEQPSEPTELLVATTTSLFDTGLLDAIQDYYLEEYNVNLLFTSQGTGKAIASAKKGDADVLLVHSPSQEKAFIEEGYGVNHRGIAYNYFILVGPAADPAGIKDMTPEEGFQILEELGTAGTDGILFVSRGDASGTHTAEQKIWKSAGYDYESEIRGSGDWYKETGAGMGDSLTTAGELGGYIFSDEATFLKYKNNNPDSPLEVIIAEGTSLLNRYTVMTISPEKFPETNVEDATAFTNWLISEEGQNFIGAFGTETYGKPLFTPMNTIADSTKAPFNIDSTTPVTVPTA